MTTIDPDDDTGGMPRILGRRINPDLAPTGMQALAQRILKRRADRQAEAEAEAIENAEKQTRRTDLFNKLRRPDDNAPNGLIS